jgi:hypothetical protein
MFFDDIEDLFRRDVAFQLSQLRLARGLQVEVFGNGFDERDQLGHFMISQQAHLQVEIRPARRLGAHPFCVMRTNVERKIASCCDPLLRPSSRHLYFCPFCCVPLPLPALLV